MIRPATPQDVPAIAQLIGELAEYERLQDQVVLDEARLHEHLFGPQPAVECLIAEQDGQAIGFALYFFNYSTFLAQRGIYLEDLFVKPQYRGQSHGKALLKAVAARAVQAGCGRMEWSVLNWNQPAIDFYERLGAVPMKEWTVYRLTGDALRSAGQ